MNCNKCKIEYKVENCCGSHPETREIKTLNIKNATLSACPHLSIRGRCNIYEDRPQMCIDYECPKSSETDVYELMFGS